MHRFPLLLGSLALSVLATAGCSNGAGPSGSNQLNFNLATRPATAAVKASAAAGTSFGLGTPETLTDGTNILVINQVQVVLRRIELRRAGAAADCSGGGSNDCAELEFGPVLIDLPLGTTGVARSFSVELAPGSYDKVEFKIHKPSSSSDAGFVQAHPDFDGVSVRVSGTYHDGVAGTDADFSFSSDVEAEMEFGLNPALVANEAAGTDLTLLVDLDHWFRNQAGTLVDPSTANSGQPNEALVEQNVKGSFQTFEDEDHDGRGDHDGADDGPNHT